MKTNERFMEALKYMNATMKADNAIGHQWKYCNVSSKKAKGGFEEKRKQKNVIGGFCKKGRKREDFDIRRS